MRVFLRKKLSKFDYEQLIKEYNNKKPIRYFDNSDIKEVGNNELCSWIRTKHSDIYFDFIEDYKVIPILINKIYQKETIFDRLIHNSIIDRISHKLIIFLIKRKMNKIERGIHYNGK